MWRQFDIYSRNSFAIPFADSICTLHSITVCPVFCNCRGLGAVAKTPWNKLSANTHAKHSSLPSGHCHVVTPDPPEALPVTPSLSPSLSPSLFPVPFPVPFPHVFLPASDLDIIYFSYRFITAYSSNSHLGMAWYGFAWKSGTPKALNVLVNHHFAHQISLNDYNRLKIPYFQTNNTYLWILWDLKDPPALAQWCTRQRAQQQLRPSQRKRWPRRNFRGQHWNSQRNSRRWNSAQFITGHLLRDQNSYNMGLG